MENTRIKELCKKNNKDFLEVTRNIIFGYGIGSCNHLHKDGKPSLIELEFMPGVFRCECCNQAFEIRNAENKYEQIITGLPLVVYPSAKVTPVPEEKVHDAWIESI